MAKNKVQAVYELREAAEEHARADAEIDADRSPANVDRLLAAKERLEVKTVEAIEACEHCGDNHCDDESHQKKTNVIKVEFAKNEGGETG
ncbi:MAG: hypothetical protein GIW97_07795 [Candidatus Eremiobacteraeota bacterium]|nr:hypothetical protein [Candidatus Eremiobacteraeota bacterium]